MLAVILYTTSHMLAQETIRRQTGRLAEVGITRSIWRWINNKFEGIDSRLQKADLLKSGGAAALIFAQLLVFIQKDTPQDTKTWNLLDQYGQDGHQANLVVRRENPWQAIYQNGRGPAKTQHGFIRLSFLLGRQPKADTDPELALIELHIPYSDALEKDDGEFKSPRLTTAMVTNPDQKYINRPATEDELRLMADLINNVTLEKI